MVIGIRPVFAVASAGRRNAPALYLTRGGGVDSFVSDARVHPRAGDAGKAAVGVVGICGAYASVGLLADTVIAVVSVGRGVAYAIESFAVSSRLPFPAIPCRRQRLRAFTERPYLPMRCCPTSC